MKNLLRLSISTLLILALFTMNGCKKNADEENGLNKKALLTSHIWKFDDLSTTSTDFNIQLFVGLAKALYGSATMNFTTGGTYTGSMLGQSENGPWEFNAGETSIIMDKGTAYETEAIIVQLTSVVLKLNVLYQDVDLGNFPVTIKLVK